MVKNTTYSNFGHSVRTILTENGTTQSGLAASLGKSPAYLNHVITGKKTPSGNWVDFVADVLKVTPEQRAHMHRSAALDAGYRIDLTPPKQNR